MAGIQAVTFDVDYISAPWKTKKTDSSSSSGSSTISTLAIQSIVDQLKSQRFRDTTRKTYWCIWRLFNKFFIRLDYKPNNWEDRIILFVEYLVENQLKSATVKTYLSAIRAVLWENNVKLNEDLVLLSSLTKACKLKNDQVVARLPIYKDLLHLLIKECSGYFQMENNQPYLSLLYKAMFVSAYYGLLRIGEVTKGPHAILASNVHIRENKIKILFLLKTLKTHSKGSQPQRIKISSTPVKEKASTGSGTKFCPFRILSDFVIARPSALNETEQFFIFRDHKPVTPIHMRTTLHKLISRMGLQPELYNRHSFQIGRGCDMVKMGVSVETVKKIGRWRSNAVFTYLRD